MRAEFQRLAVIAWVMFIIP